MLNPFWCEHGRIQSLYSNAGPGRLLEGRAVPVPNAGSIQISDPERGPCRGEIAGQGRFVAAGSVRVAGDDCAAVTNVVGNSVRATNNPNKVGKDVGIWSSCYLVMENAIRSTMT